MTKKNWRLSRCERDSKTTVRQTKQLLTPTQTQRYINNKPSAEIDSPLIFLPFLCLLFCTTRWKKNKANTTSTNSTTQSLTVSKRVSLFLPPSLQQHWWWKAKTNNTHTHIKTYNQFSLALFVCSVLGNKNKKNTIKTKSLQHAIVFVFHHKKKTNYHSPVYQELRTNTRKQNKKKETESNILKKEL